MRLDTQNTNTAFTEVPNIEINGRSVVTDADGYLLDYEEWEPGIADLMAKTDGVKLDADHWLAINFLRSFYDEYGIAPELYLMQKALCKSAYQCRWNRKYLRTLFPINGAKDACRYAGLPKPGKGACG